MQKEKIQMSTLNNQYICIGMMLDLLEYKNWNCTKVNNGTGKSQHTK
jgi:hypothetical protein